MIKNILWDFDGVIIDSQLFAIMALEKFLKILIKYWLKNL